MALNSSSSNAGSLPRARLGWVAGLILLLAGCSGADTPEPTVNVPMIGTAQAVPTLVRPPEAQPLPSAVANWQALGLSGRLLYTPGPQRLEQLDLTTGQVQTLFQAPSNGWLTFATVAPDGAQLVVAYAPPPAPGTPQLGYTNLYQLPGDCAQRQDGCGPEQLIPLRLAQRQYEAYFSPIWSPDGRYLYYGRFEPSEAGGASFAYRFERMALPAGEPEPIVNDVLWPALSPDGSQLAYVVQVPEGGSNDLYLAAADGSNPRRLLEPGLFYAVDAPVFTPDGQSVVFSAVDTAPVLTASNRTRWLDRFLGVRTAEAAPPAHSVPSDWWQVSIEGGAPVRLTRVYDTGLFGDFSPAGQWLGYISQSGIYVMAPNGSQLTRLREISLTGTLNWIP